MAIQIIKVFFIILFLICAVEDIRTKKIRFGWLIAMAAVMGADAIINQDVSLFVRLGGIVLGCVFLLLNKVTKQQIGMGDGILLTIAGGYLGIFGLLEFVMYGLLLAAVVAMILLAVKRANRKQQIPFVPFLLFGFLVRMYIGG